MKYQINHSIYVEHKIVEMLTIVPNAGDEYFKARGDLGEYVMKYGEGDPECVMSLGEYEFRGWINEPETGMTHFWINEITRHAGDWSRVTTIPESYEDDITDEDGNRPELTVVWHKQKN